MSALQYTTLATVKELLKKSAQDRVHFPGLANQITVFDKSVSTNDYITNISVDQQKLYCDPCFEGNLKVGVVFTSPTEFEVYKTNVGGRDFRALLDGTGDINTEYVTTGGEVTIEANAFGGSPQANQEVQFEFEVHMSEERAETIIRFAEIHMRSQIKSLLIDPADLDADEELEFVAAHMGAYYIWVDVFMSDDVRDNRPSFIDRWKKRADEVLKLLITTHSTEINGVGVNAFPTTVPKIGHYIEQGGSSGLQGFDGRSLESDVYFDSDFPNDYSGLGEVD